MKNHINANMVVYIVIGKMNRVKEETLMDIKETSKKEYKEYKKHKEDKHDQV